MWPDLVSAWRPSPRWRYGSRGRLRATVRRSRPLGERRPGRWTSRPGARGRGGLGRHAPRAAGSLSGGSCPTPTGISATRTSISSAGSASCRAQRARRSHVRTSGRPGADARQGRDEAMAGVRPNDSDEPWRAYYVARNFLHLARAHGSPCWTAWHFAYSARRMQLASSNEERLATVHGLIDGMRGRLGAHPRYQSQRANSTSRLQSVLAPDRRSREHRSSSPLCEAKSKVERTSARPLKRFSFVIFVMTRPSTGGRRCVSSRWVRVSVLHGRVPGLADDHDQVDDGEQCRSVLGREKGCLDQEHVDDVAGRFDEASRLERRLRRVREHRTQRQARDAGDLGRPALATSSAESVSGISPSHPRMPFVSRPRTRSACHPSWRRARGRRPRRTPSPG